MRWCVNILKVTRVSHWRYCAQQRQVHADTAAIISIATGCPKQKLTRNDSLDIAKKAVQNEKKWPFLDRIYASCGVENRYTPFHIDYLKYLVDIDNNKRPEHLTEEEFLFPQSTLQVPIDQRHKTFKHMAAPLALDVSSRAIKESGVNPADIGNVIVMSSTAFIAPGIHSQLITDLGLSKNTESMFVPLLGCGAAVSGLRLANDFVLSNQRKKALIVCIELNSLHLQMGDNDVQLVLQAIGGDGCGAAVVGAVNNEASLPAGSIKMVDQHTIFFRDERASIVTVTSESVGGTLSKDVPKVIQNNIKLFADTLLTRNNITKNDIDFWGIHPGGAPILTAVQRGLDITREDLSESWGILRDYANVGSPTVLFVLEQLIKKHKTMVAEGQKGLKSGLSVAVTPGMSLDGFYLEMI